MVDITDVVTYTNFGDHRLRGFWVAGGQISPLPIDFHRRPYYRASVWSITAVFSTNIVKKLNSLKHLVRTTVAESHN